MPRRCGRPGNARRPSAVLEQATIENPKDPALLGAYGRALADVGNYQQALDVLGRAHTPDNPDWRILNVQGAVLDQLGRHMEARRYYASALKIVPNEPSVLSNLGLSYALAKELKRAETILRLAVAQPNAEPKVRQNLGLVVGLQGRFEEAEKIVRADLPADEASANAAYLGRCWRSRATGRNSASSSTYRAPIAATDQRYWMPITLITAGPKITTNSTGKKNRIIGTVSFGGRPAAFFSASDMRMSRFSCAITRSVLASGVP